MEVTIRDRVILHDISFSVKRGDFAAIIGPNGAGKTTLFRALIGSIPHGGTVVWAKDARIGYVPQHVDLDRHLALTLQDFLQLKSRVLNLPDTAVNDVAQMLHIDEGKLKLPLSSLSAGELQRGLIAFALIGNPNVLLFDEPTANLDAPGEEHIYQTLHKLQNERDMTILFISHDLNLVTRYADTVICVSSSLFCAGPPKETLTPEVVDKLYGSLPFEHIHAKK